MIRMFIAGEEVVCDKDFTIKEEMLSASSTILNNCYPKSWEENRDYVNKFYFPKDYSKFILGEGEFADGINQYRIMTASEETDENIEFNTNAETTIQKFNIYGKTYQETRETKNLIYLDPSKTVGNLTITNNGDGTLTLNGSVSDDTTINIGNYQNRVFVERDSRISFHQKINNQSGSINGSCILCGAYYNYEGTRVAFIEDNNGAYQSSWSSAQLRKVWLKISASTSFTNYKIFPQIEVGMFATTPEQYNQMPSFLYPSPLRYPVKIVDDDFYYNLQITNGEHIDNYSYRVITGPLKSLGDLKDILYVENGYLYVKRYIGEELALNTDHIVIDKMKSNGLFMCNIGGYVENKTVYFQDTLSNSSPSYYALVIYELETPVIENLGKVVQPKQYKGNNVANFDVGEYQTTAEILYKYANYDILFSGVVKNTGDINLNPRYPHYCSLQILDYKTFLSESDTLDFVIDSKTIKEAIEMVIEAVSGYGFVEGNINISQQDDIINAYSTLNKTAYDVLQYLANISGSRWRTRFINEKTIAIDFYDPDLLPQADDIEYTKQYWEDNDIIDLTFNYSTRDYRNKQIMLSDKVYASILYSEILVSTGYNTTYLTENNIASISSIKINGVEKSFATTVEKEIGAEADFYYTPSKNVIESNITYNAGTQIIVSYIPLIKGRQIVYNNDEIGRIANQTNTIGVISRYEARNDVLSSDELTQIGQSYIKYKGKPEIILTLLTHNKDLYDIGEVVYFNAPIEDLQDSYMVKAKEIQYIANKDNINLFYSYELTSSFNSEKEINYFDNQRNKAVGNINEGESITRNIDIENTANIIWDNLTIKEIEVDGDNILNSPLNSPFLS